LHAIDEPPVLIPARSHAFPNISAAQHMNGRWATMQRAALGGLVAGGLLAGLGTDWRGSRRTISYREQATRQLVASDKHQAEVMERLQRDEAELRQLANLKAANRISLDERPSPRPPPTRVG